MKTDFEARPVFLQRDDRIRAHFLTCLLSLLMMRILEKESQQGGQEVLRQGDQRHPGRDGLLQYPGRGVRPGIHKDHPHRPSPWLGRLQDRYPNYHQTNDEKNNIIHQKKR